MVSLWNHSPPIVSSYSFIHSASNLSFTLHHLYLLSQSHRVTQSCCAQITHYLSIYLTVVHNLFNLSLPYLVNLLVSSTHSLSIVLTSIEPIEDWSMEEHASIVVAISQEINFLSKVSSVYNTREKANNCLLSSLLLSYIVVNYSKINQLLSDHICVPVVQPYRWSVYWSYCCSVCWTYKCSVSPTFPSGTWIGTSECSAQRNLDMIC